MRFLAMESEPTEVARHRSENGKKLAVLLKKCAQNHSITPSNYLLAREEHLEKQRIKYNSANRNPAKSGVDVYRRWFSSQRQNSWLACQPQLCTIHSQTSKDKFIILISARARKIPKATCGCGLGTTKLISTPLASSNWSACAVIYPTKNTASSRTAKVRGSAGRNESRSAPPSSTRLPITSQL